MKITLELDSVEAHLAIGALTDAQATAHVEAARRKGIDGEYAGIRAQVLGRVAGRIADGLIPEDPRLVILREQVELRML